MLRGTKVLTGEEARRYVEIISVLRRVVHRSGLL